MGKINIHLQTHLHKSVKMIKDTHQTVNIDYSKSGVGLVWVVKRSVFLPKHVYI